MNVEQILSEKGRGTVTIARERTLAEAISLLGEKKIGAVVIVSPDGAVEGILSERDVVRALAERGAEALSEAVSTRMTAKVATCTGTASLPDLMAMMTNGRFRHVPVVEGGRLVGMVSIGDVVKRRVAQMESEHSALRDYIATG